MKKYCRRGIASSVGVFLSLGLAGCHSSEGESREMPNPPVPASKATETEAVVSAQNRFGVALLSRLVKTTPHQNVFISPFSVTQALMLAANGAAGETQEVLTKTLLLGDGVTVETANTQNALLRTALTAPPKDGYGIQLVVANALWADKRFPLTPSYVETCRTFYGAEAASLDFTQAAPTANTINAWVSKNTKGLIPSIVTPDLFQSTPPVGAVLTNAVYFKARWSEEFWDKETKPAPFTSDEGTVKQVQMMQQTGSHAFAYQTGDGFTAARLGYRGPASLSVFLPDKGHDVAALLDKLNTTGGDQWRKNWDSNVEMDLYLPRFKTEYATDLIPPLREMGLTPALDARADFSPMGLKGGFIGSIIHKTYLDINEEGTEAAAATAVAMSGAAAPLEPPRKKVVFRVDGPFVLMVVDEQQGTVLFLGAIYHP